MGSFLLPKGLCLSLPAEVQLVVDERLFSLQTLCYDNLGFNSKEKSKLELKPVSGNEGVSTGVKI